MRLSTGKDRFVMFLAICLFFLPLVIALYLIDIDLWQFFLRFENFKTVIPLFMSLQLTALPDIIYQLFISIALAILGLLTGGFFALILAFLGANNLAFSPLVSGVIKGGISIIRGIPSLILMLMVAASLGFGYTAGIIGLAISSVGYLTKAFMATIEEQDYAIIETLKSTGASWFQIVTEGIFPVVKDEFVAWIFIRLESNITDSISLGLVGAGGIGFLLNTALRQHNFPLVTTIVLIIFGTVFLIELNCEKIKKHLKS